MHLTDEGESHFLKETDMQGVKSTFDLAEEHSLPRRSHPEIRLEPLLQHQYASMCVCPCLSCVCVCMCVSVCLCLCVCVGGVLLSHFKMLSTTIPPRTMTTMTTHLRVWVGTESSGPSFFFWFRSQPTKSFSIQDPPLLAPKS